MNMGNQPSNRFFSSNFKIRLIIFELYLVSCKRELYLLLAFLIICEELNKLLEKKIKLLQV